MGARKQIQQTIIMFVSAGNEYEHEAFLRGSGPARVVPDSISLLRGGRRHYWLPRPPPPLSLCTNIMAATIFVHYEISPSQAMSPTSFLGFPPELFDIRRQTPERPDDINTLVPGDIVQSWDPWFVWDNQCENYETRKE